MPVLERNAILDRIEKGDFDSIMKAWFDAGRVENDPTKQGTIGTVWGWEMQQRPVPHELYVKMKAAMDDPSYSIHERGGMIGVLSRAATPEAAKLLIDEANTQTDVEMKRMATFALRELGNSANETVAALLEPLWKESNDPLMLQSVAKAIGRIGKASSVEILFNAALAAYGDLHDERGLAAWDGLRLVYTENAIPPLAAALEKNPPGSEASKLALGTLAQIVNPAPNGGASPRTVIKWLQTADSSAAPSAKEWVGKSQQLEAAQAALDPSVPFRSEANRQALRAGLDAYRAGHKREL